MTFLFVHSKSKARPIASRTRGSLNCSRRVLKYQPCEPVGAPLCSDLLLDPPVVDGREIVAGRPDARGVFLVEVDRAGLERLEGDLPLAVIFEAQPIEIVLADD